MKRTIATVMLSTAILLMASCSLDSDRFSRDDSLATRSFDQLSPEDFFVSIDDVNDYILYKSAGRTPLWTAKDGGVSSKKFNPELAKVIVYPNRDNACAYIVNYPNGYWEILSADKRTQMILAAGEGSFSLDSENTNLAGWLMDMAEEVKALKKYDGPIKNAEDNYKLWKAYANGAKSVRKAKETGYDIVGELPSIEDIDMFITRSGSDPDTSYHPVPGHYGVLESGVSYFYPSYTRNHLISTQWSDASPYNQYCPKNPDIPGLRASAGSEAVAGGQIVYYMHYLGDSCPSVYGSAYCDTYFGPNMDWSAMDQFDKYASNWANFQTSDSTRMAAVLLANIGKGMQMEYGANYSYGTLGSLQDVLLDEYELDCYNLPFANCPVNPYSWIKEALDEGIPSIVHSGSGSGNTLPYTFIIDGYRNGTEVTYDIYKFFPASGYDPQYDNLVVYHPVAVVSTYQFCMNWGNGGIGSEIWCAYSGNWFLSTEDHSNREAFLSFCTQGEDPFNPGM